MSESLIQRAIRGAGSLEAFLAQLQPDHRSALFSHWPAWGRPEQLEPHGSWRVWLVLAGRGFGKSRLGAEFVRSLAMKHPGCHIGMVARTAGEVRSVMVKALTMPWVGGILDPRSIPHHKPSERLLEWPNGSHATTYSADEPRQILGQNFDFFWCFVAGTLVETINGPMPIERIRPTDEVITRHGAACTLAVSVRTKQVGRVVFSDGRELIGTGCHPVLTNNGWTRLDALRVGESVVTATRLGTSTERRCFGTDGNGSDITGQSRLDVRSIIETETARITNWLTSSACRSRLTAIHTAQAGQLLGLSINDTASLVGYVAASHGGLPGSGTESAASAHRSTPSRSARASESAGNAARGSSLDVAISAVSVASTWEGVGERRVYDLRTSAREFIANGIVVHNCDELAAWPATESARKETGRGRTVMEEVWHEGVMLALRGSGVRIDRTRGVVTTTPRPKKLIREILRDADTIVTRGSTYDNAVNLGPEYIAGIKRVYEGTRLGRQEVHAEVLDDLLGALWTGATIDEHRVKPDKLPDMVRVVIGVDPSGKSEGGDEQGIVVVGRGTDGHAYVLADRTTQDTPDGWGRRVVHAYEEFKADRIVVETNFGGQMAIANIANAANHRGYQWPVDGESGPVRAVVASRGKVVRAEPVAALYEQGRVHHVGEHQALETQMREYVPDDGVSPDRMDALVWAVTDLMVRGPTAWDAFSD